MGRIHGLSAAERQRRREERMAKWLSTPEGQDCKQKADSLMERFGPELDKIGKECRELFSDGAYVYSYDVYKNENF